MIQGIFMAALVCLLYSFSTTTTRSIQVITEMIVEYSFSTSAISSSHPA